MSTAHLASRILDVRGGVAPSRAALVALTGIDGCGKGWIAARTAEALRASGLRVAVINADGWLNLPSVRFSETDPAAHFYAHALRQDEMYERLALPLRDTRSVDVETDVVEETATSFRRRRWTYRDVDVILLEGIFLLKRAFAAHHDLSCWIDCTYGTALERAIARAQEGLSPEDTVRAYRTIYFPAQEIHRVRDRPRAAASMILVNDPRLERERRSAAPPA